MSAMETWMMICKSFKDVWMCEEMTQCCDGRRSNLRIAISKTCHHEIPQFIYSVQLKSDLLNMESFPGPLGSLRVNPWCRRAIDS